MMAVVMKKNTATSGKASNMIGPRLSASPKPKANIAGAKINRFTLKKELR